MLLTIIRLEQPRSRQPKKAIRHFHPAKTHSYKITIAETSIWASLTYEPAQLHT